LQIVVRTEKTIDSETGNDSAIDEDLVVEKDEDSAGDKEGATGVDESTDMPKREPKSRPRSVARVPAESRWRDPHTVIIALVVLAVAMAVVIGVLSYLFAAESGTVSDNEAAAADRNRAEEIALDYAAGAAEMDFRELSAWRERLTNGTSPQMADKLTEASTAMEQVITPLQWVSTSRPIAAKVLSEDDGVYTVAAFVGVLTKNAQAPDGVQSTATYNVIIDKKQDWKITDVAGIDADVTGPK